MRGRITARGLVASAVLVLIGALAGYAVRDAMVKKEDRGSFVERREGEFRLINPLLECDIAADVLKNRELRPFKDRVEDFLTTRMDKRWARNVTVYFRELNDGLWFSIGETERFTPASLRKVPLMIALFKEAERQTGLMARKVKFRLSRDYNAAQNIKPSEAMVPGLDYSVGDLIQRMIVYSDNNAFTLLGTVVDPAELRNVYSTLRVNDPRNAEDDDFLSVQTYASFFRVLYNATYLNRDMSGLALELLAKAEFRAGLVAGVPPEVTVAHKFGEHSDEKDGTVQLHDCGIVYYPRHPYLLCIMSKGTSFEYLDDVIASVSKAVFTEVDGQHRTERRQ